jgi:23S rRNA (adenine2503-C2)-methyltransferase
VRSRYDLSRTELAELLDGEPKYRSDQLTHGLYRDLVDPSEITTLSKSLRERLMQTDALRTALQTVVERRADNGETIKWLSELHDGKRVETVLMHYADRSTVCVSSQAGCAMNCSFCATGQAGFDRNLSVGEIVEQVVMAMRQARSDDRHLTNIVFMGMGEPLANFDRLWPAITRIHDDLGIGARHITVSTVGVIPGIRRMTEEALPVNLAVSLHAANDELRNTLVPLNKRYPIADLVDACRDYIEAKGRRLSFEWALIHDVNDRMQDARELAEIALSLGAHINVIPLNPTPGYLVRGSSPKSVQRFVDTLNDLGVNATIRTTRGSDIDAACGQLAAANASNTVKQPNVTLRTKKRAD